MPKTLLAVDDSATMRKVLEITFSGEDFRVVTAEGRDAALGKLSEEPSVVVIDTALGAEDGYGLAAEIRQKSPSSVIILMASRYHPYDQAKGKDSGADDFMDKPFDTQQMIDKVKKGMLAREGGQPAAAAVAPAARPAAAATAPTPSPRAAAVAPAPAPAKAARQPTLMFGGDPQNPGAPGGAARMPDPNKPSTPHMAAAAPVAAAPAAAAARPAAPAVASAVNGQMQSKLGDLGLSPQQADAVMALSREVVERVVWEVVPQLAEAIIKEEIARLTREA
ncbi:MAG: response regulator receiver protein [Myxococcaceae bacterium]|nr:response regulator receiver protein [Myxococcaceae bacterium]